MKKSVMIGTALLTAAICASALAGCKSSAFAVANYAEALEESNYAATTARFASSTEIEGAADYTAIVNNLMRVRRDDYKYAVYDLDAKKFVGNDVSADRVTLAYYPFILLTDNSIGESGTQSVYSVMLPNGNKIHVTPKEDEIMTEAPEFSTRTCLVKSVQKTVYMVTYNGYRRYFAFSDARGSEYGKTFEEIPESDIYGLFSVDTAFSNIPRYSIYSEETAYDGYSYSETEIQTSLGSSSEGLFSLGTHHYTFFNNSTQIGTCTVSNGEGFFLGKYLYYYEMTSVDSDATKGYNLVLASTTSLKFNVNYYRYDFTKNKSKKISTDYIFVGCDSLYNQSDKAYDCAAAYGFKKENGVAVVGTATPVSTVLVNDKLKVQEDYTGKEFLPWKATKIANDRYIVAGEGSSYYLFDGSLKTLAAFAVRPTVYADAQLISTETSSSSSSTAANSQYYAVDFNGKIIMRNLYNAYRFYGSTALVTINGERLFISASNPDGESLEKRHGENAIAQNGLVRVPENGELGIYNYENTKITSIPTTSISSQFSNEKRECIVYTDSSNKQHSVIFE